MFVTRMLNKEGYSMSKKKTRKIYRDAKTGKFVTKKYVERNPNTTVTETMPAPQRKNKKKRRKR